MRLYALPWRELFLMMPAISLLFGLTWTAIRRGGLLKQGRRLALAMLAVWLIFELEATLAGRGDNPHQWQPLFESYRDAAKQPELLRSNFWNILLYFPGGLLLSAAADGRKKAWALRLAAFGMLLALSLGTETVQYYAGIGWPETDDIFHNTLGAIFGIGAALTAPAVMGLVLDTLLGRRVDEKNK